MDCSLPGSSVHGIFQARILEWVAISFSRSSQPRDWTQVSHIIGRRFIIWAIREAIAIAASNSKEIFIHRYNKRYNFIFVAGGCGWLSARCKNNFRKKKLCGVGLVFRSSDQNAKKYIYIFFSRKSVYFSSQQKNLCIEMFSLHFSVWV